MTLDTNILIAYLDGEEQVVSAINELFQNGRVCILPATVFIELLSFPAFTVREIYDIEHFLFSNFLFVPIDQNISRITAQIRRSMKIRTPDATIAATALATNTPLVTRNEKDFKNISDLEIQSL